MGRNKFGFIIFSLYAIGFVLYFVGPYRDYGAGILIAAIAAHIIYTFSPPQRAAVSMLNARRQTELGNIEKAKEFVLKSVKLSKNYTLTGYLLSNSKRAFPFYKKLAEALQKELDTVEDKTHLRYIIASIYYSIGDLKNAEKVLSEVNEKEYNLEVVRLLGTVLLEESKFNEAIKVFKKKEKKEGVLSSKDLAILVGLGLSYAGKGDLDTAEKYYKKAKQYNPTFPELQKLKEKIYSIDD